MKSILSKIAVIVAITTTAAQVQAYSYIFSNHTKDEIGVAMRFYGLGEPRYFRWIPANQARQFTPNQAVAANERPIEGRKIGFVAKTWWYVKNPAPAQKATNDAAKTLPWNEFQISWIPTESYEIAKKLGEAIAHATVNVAKVAIDATIAYTSGGASVPAQAAMAAAQQGNIPGIFANLIPAASESISRSMMTDRHIDIIEDPSGKVYFISQL